MRKHTLALAISAILLSQPLQAEEAELLPEMTVEGAKLSDVSEDQVKSADLADALFKNIPSISLVRRSGIANDVILRGQKKDNINILIDDAKIYGACPNRMDPPTSHVLTNNIDAVEVIEGPYDVENFGTLSGAVKITTKKPSKELSGEVNLNVGSWGYKKASASASGGNDKFRILVTGSKETSGQYEDGDGNTFAEQVQNYTAGNPALAGVNYKPEYRDQDAYDKATFMGKVYFDITDNQELMLSYTGNRSDDVLYPSSPMDALYDNSDIFNMEYKLKRLGAFSKELDFQVYDSKVDHPMSTFYRVSSGPGSVNEKVNALTSEIRGVTLKNSFDLSRDAEMTVGVDASQRNWDGHFEGSGTQAIIDGTVVIDDVNTDNRAVFAEVEKDFNNFNLRVGARYDDTSIEPGSFFNDPTNDYNNLSGFVFGTYEINQGIKLFGGIGRSARVPDARELYLHMPMVTSGVVSYMPVGTPNLKQTTNDEIDLGIESNISNLTLKTKIFYSWLSDFIFYNASQTMHNFENADASIYGLDISGSYYATDDVYLDFGMALQTGRKDQPLTGQTDLDMPEIPPLKLNLALNYDYMPNSTARAEVVASEAWTNYDADNGEQRLDGYAVLNLKVAHELTRNFEVTLGVDNVFDKTYAVSNTYKDLTLITAGADEVILMNEPGRYLYLNGTYKF